MMCKQAAFYAREYMRDGRFRIDPDDLRWLDQEGALGTAYSRVIERYARYVIPTTLLIPKAAGKP